MRTAGKTGVAVGTLVWAAPLVQTTVPAWAAVGSGVPAGGTDETAGGTGVLAVEEARANSGSNGSGGGVMAGAGELARTGAEPWNLAKLAGGAIAIGGTASAVGRKLKRQDTATELGHDGGCVDA